MGSQRESIMKEVSYYQLAVENNLRILHNLSHLLDKAAAYCAELKIEERALLEARLFPDMFPLVRQIQAVSDMTQGCAARLIGQEPLNLESKETSFAELQKRITQSAVYLKAVKETDFAGCESREVHAPHRDKPMRGEVFLLCHALPNIFCPTPTACNLLRHNGVPVGKADFLGPFRDL
jgi:hypothetical protein